MYEHRKTSNTVIKMFTTGKYSAEKKVNIILLWLSLAVGWAAAPKNVSCMYAGRLINVYLTVNRILKFWNLEKKIEISVSWKNIHKICLAHSGCTLLHTINNWEKTKPSASGSKLPWSLCPRQVCDVNIGHAFSSITLYTRNSLP